MCVYDPNVSLKEIERRYILDALEFHGQDLPAVSRHVGISLKTLYSKLHQYGSFQRRSKKEKYDASDDSGLPAASIGEQVLQDASQRDESQES